MLKNLLYTNAHFIFFLLIILLLSNTHTCPFWLKAHNCNFTYDLCPIQSKLQNTVLQSPWRNLGLSVWFKGTMVTVDSSNSPVYESSFLGLEPAPFRSEPISATTMLQSTQITIKMMHCAGMMYGKELSGWKLNRPAIQQRRAWAAGGLWNYMEKTVLQLPVCPCDLRGQG